MNTIHKNYGRLIANARKNVGYSQETVAEMLHISVSSMRKYETGEYLPQEDIIAQMVRLYNSPRLGYEWLRQNSVGEMLLPEVAHKPVYEIYADVYRGIKEAKHLEDRMGNITRDNVIERHEQLTNTRGRVVFEKIIAAAFSYLVHEKTTPARVAR